MSVDAAWTIMVFMAGDNDLSLAGEHDLAEMRHAGSSEAVRVVAEFDSEGGEATRRVVFGPPGADEEIVELGETDSGSPDAVLDFVDWAARRCPARRYALILWSHGTGWAPAELERIAAAASPAGVPVHELNERAASPLGRVLFRTSLARVLALADPAERAICADDGSGHSLDTIELGRLLRSVAERLGRRLDLLGMDACLMGNLEVACEVRESVRCLVASEEDEPGDGWPYHRWLPRLIAAPDMPAGALGETIVDAYFRHYDAVGFGGRLTQAAVDLDRLDQVFEPLRRFSEAATGAIGACRAALWHAQRRAARFGHNTLWDLRQVCAEVATQGVPDPVRAAAGEVADALAPGEGRAVIAADSRGSRLAGSGGLSIYMVPPITPLSRFYGELAFARHHPWAAMLEAYHGV